MWVCVYVNITVCVWCMWVQHNNSNWSGTKTVGYADVSWRKIFITLTACLQPSKNCRNICSRFLPVWYLIAHLIFSNQCCTQSFFSLAGIERTVGNELVNWLYSCDFNITIIESYSCFIVLSVLMATWGGACIFVFTSFTFFWKKNKCLS